MTGHVRDASISPKQGQLPGVKVQQSAHRNDESTGNWWVFNRGGCDGEWMYSESFESCGHRTSLLATTTTAKTILS